MKRRAKTGLREIGDAAKRAALLASLVKHEWSFARVAEEFRMAGCSNVIHAIKHLGLGAEYEAAKAGGLVRMGPRPRSGGRPRAAEGGA